MFVSTVKVEVNARSISVTGPRGNLKREFRHLPVDIQKTAEGAIKVDVWFGNRETIAAIRCVCYVCVCTFCCLRIMMVVDSFR